MNSKKTLLIVAGTGVEKRNGQLFSKPQFVKYFEELALYYEITWLTNEYRSTNFKNPLVSIETEVISKNRFKAHILKLQVAFLRKAFFADAILIFLPGGVQLFPASFFLNLFKGKLFTYIGVDFENQEYSRNPLTQLLWASTLRFIIKKSSGVICRGQYLLELAANVRGDHRDLINTIPLAAFNRDGNFQPIVPKTKFANKRLLFVGQVKKSKGIFDLIHLMTDLKIDNVTLQVIGTGSDLTQAIQLVEALNITHKVIFSGWIDNLDYLAEIYNSSSMLIQPSIEPEGVPRTIDEAIFYHTPVIATKVGGVDLEFQNGEILKVNPGNLQDLKIAIEKMLGTFKQYMVYYGAMEKRRLFISNETAASQHIKFIEQCKS